MVLYGEGFVHTPLEVFFFFLKEPFVLLLMWMRVVSVEIIDLLELVIGGL